MKKLFAILISALFALTIVACGERFAPSGSQATDDPASKVTASPVPSEKMIEVPTETPTEEPAEAPTAAPTEEPIPYDREEYDALLAFFELKDENGVKNGEKCFKDYDPEKVRFWGADPEDVITPKESCLLWNDEGKLYSAVLYALDESSAKLVGEINLNTFDSLHTFNAYIAFDSFNEDVKNCSSIYSVDFLCENDAVLTSDYIPNVRFSSLSHCRYESYDESFLGGALAFTANLTSDGSGRVGINAYSDTHYYVVSIYAIPVEGHRFIGWYNADGELISTEAEIELSYEHDTGWSVHDFTGTAKFE